jgi:hypothetical protein
MTTPGRLAAALVVTAVCVALPFARTPDGPARPPVTASFSAMGLSFRYPATWRTGTSSDEVSSFTALIVYLSTSRLQDSRTFNPSERSLPCTYPLAQLPPGGVLVRWNADGFPDFQLPKPDTTIGGR